MHHGQESQQSLFLFLSYLPLIRICVQALTPEPYDIQTSWMDISYQDDMSQRRIKTLTSDRKGL